MSPKVDSHGTARRIMKLHGTVVGVDLVHGVVTIQPADHTGKRARQLSVGAGAHILAGPERLTLADVFVGDPVQAHFIRENEHEVLTSLRLPRTLTSGHPPRPKSSDPSGTIPGGRSASGEA